MATKKKKKKKEDRNQTKLANTKHQSGKTPQISQNTTKNSAIDHQII